MVEADAVLAGCLQQHVGAPDVGLQEGRRVGDGVVVVALGGEVHARVGMLEEPADERRVADVADDELAPALGDARKVPGVARVGELVEDDHPDAGLVLGHPVAEVGADEPGPSGDYYRFQGASRIE